MAMEKTSNKQRGLGAVIETEIGKLEAAARSTRQRKAPDCDGQLQLFSAIFTDILPRDAQDTMAIPFLSLSKRPRFDPLRFRDERRGIHVTISGGKPWGIANIWDWDVMMWLMAQLRQAIDSGEDVSPRIRFHRHAFLKDVRRAAGGAQYRRLEEAITRLKNTHVRTSIRAANGKTEMFNWIERATIERDARGRMAYAVVQLPDWLFRAARDHQLVLTLHGDYFLLTGGLERWLYRFVRKAAGTGSWQVRYRTLYERSGSTQRFSDFTRDLRKLVARGVLLDYRLEESTRAESGETLLRATNVAPRQYVEPTQRPTNAGSVDFLALESAKSVRLKTVTYEKAKRAAPGYDVYALESQWREASRKNGIQARNPDEMFLRWCRSVHQRSPLVRGG